MDVSNVAEQLAEHLSVEPERIPPGVEMPIEAAAEVCAATPDMLAYAGSGGQQIGCEATKISDDLIRALKEQLDLRRTPQEVVKGSIEKAKAPTEAERSRGPLALFLAPSTLSFGAAVSRLPFVAPGTAELLEAGVGRAFPGAAPAAERPGALAHSEVSERKRGWRTRPSPFSAAPAFSAGALSRRWLDAAARSA